MSRTDIIAIVWASHEARTASFADWLEAPLYNIYSFMRKGAWAAAFKYPINWVKTWYVLLKNRPKYVYFCDSPPVAGLCIYIYCLFMDTKYIMDTHPPNLLGSKWGWTAPLQRFLARHAEMNVVDQEQFREMFASWGAKVMTLENPPKNIPEEWLTPVDPNERVSFTYVGTMGSDEPIGVLIEAAKQLPDVDFHITGNKDRAKPEWVAEAGDNVHFTGYLLKDEFWGRLSRSHGIIALTEHTYSLQGAAMDGLYIDKPLILSEQPTLTRKFSKGAVFANNTTEGMVQAVHDFLENKERLDSEIRELREETTLHWQENFRALQALIGQNEATAVDSAVTEDERLSKAATAPEMQTTDVQTMPDAVREPQTTLE